MVSRLPTDGLLPLTEAELAEEEADEDELDADFAAAAPPSATRPSVTEADLAEEEADEDEPGQDLAAAAPPSATRPSVTEADLAEEETDEDEPGEDFTAVTPASAAARPSVIEHRFLVENECHGFRLDRFLQKKMARMSRSRIQRVIEGDCDVDGRKARSSLRVQAGQHVSFRRPAPTEPDVPRNLTVRYTDPEFYVLEKPAGLPIHPTARYHYSTLTAVLRERFPGEALHVAHRLDRETSGLLLVARNKSAESALKKAFARRLVSKRYLAIVHGALDIPEDTPLILDQPIGAAGSAVRVRMAIRTVEEGGLTARTEVRTLRRAGPYSLVECRPHTGRQHQIRVHLFAAGYPIVGDKLYPDEEVFISWVENGDAAVHDRLPLLRHALHAAGLSFPHPVTGVPIQVDSPLPDELAAFLATHAADREVP